MTVELDQIARILAECRGTPARVYSYELSHSKLLVHVSGQEKTHFYQLVLDDVTWICGPLEWTNSNLRVHYEDDDNEYVLADTRAQFVVVCSLIRARRIEPDDVSD